MTPTHVPPMFAFGFGNVLMLGWLAAAALPVIIHLWNKRRYREVSWAAMEYLLVAMRKNSRRIQVEQWLLLTVRTLIVAFTVLALAEPFLERMGLSFIAGTRTLKVLVIDGSYSMAYKPTDKSRFDRAKQLTRQIVEESPQGDGFTLVLMASPPTVIVGKPAMEKQEFYDEIENLKLPQAGGDLLTTLAKVEEILHGSEKSGLDRKEVFFLTDLQRTSWMPEASTDDLRKRVEQMAAGASLVVLDLGQGSLENLAVTQLNTAEPFVTIEDEVTIRAQVRNFGTQPKLRHAVELYVDKRRVNDTAVDIKPGETVPVAFRQRFDTPGEHLVEVRLASDLLEIDNHRWLALPVKQNLRVLIVDGKPAGDGLSGAADYVMLALNPNANDAASHFAVKPEVASESAILERELPLYDAVFLCNVGQFTASEARVLANYVKGGGGLVTFLGDRVDKDRYNRELVGESGVRVLPATLGAIVSEAQYRFDPLEYRHPLVAAFKGREQAGLLTTPIYKYFKLEPAKDSRARVALAFAGGDPAIVEEQIGRGRSILFATEGSLSSIDPATKMPWSAMPAWPSFVPIVQESLALAVGSQMAAYNVQVGDTLAETIRGRAGKQSLKMELPSGRDEPLRLTTADEGSRWSFSDTLVSGPYRAVSAGTPGSSSADSGRLFAVNVDTRESNLARIDAAELPPQFTTASQASVDESSTVSVTRHSGLNKSLLYAVMALLFVEVFLAWRAGHAAT